MTASAALSFQRVTHHGSAPERWMLFLHGILGRGVNWRGVARRFVEARPEWGAALVDLRLHGASSAGFAPPHTLESAARDLDSLDGALRGRVAGVLGHSFGGKVALAYLDGRRALPAALDVALIVDAAPGVREGGRATEETLQVFDFLAAEPLAYPSRRHFIARATDAGLAQTTAEWLATNLHESPSGELALGLDLPSLRALLDDYMRRDLWPVIERPPGATALHLVVAARARTWSPPERQRAAAVAAASHGQVAVHTLDTGHWVHVDDPDGLGRILVAATAPRPPRDPAV